jgi:hypothetical protein
MSSVTLASVHRTETEPTPTRVELPVAAPVDAGVKVDCKADPLACQH